MGDPFTISTDLSSLNDLIDELGVAVEEAARPAAQAGADVLYKEVKRNVSLIGRKTGNLERSIYQVFSKRDSKDGAATYYVSWNTTKAPHGHLVEYGHIQRYEYYKNDQGKIRPMVRPEMQGKPRPRNDAPQSVKDAYYVPRKGGPIQVAARSFVRKAASAMPEALKAAEDELLKRIMKG